MTEEQFDKLLLLYRKGKENNLTYDEFLQEVRKAKIQIEESFVEDGKEDTNLGEYLDELEQFRNLVTT